MISYLFGLLGYLVTLMLQLSVFSQWKILAGNADLAFVCYCLVCTITQVSLAVGADLCGDHKLPSALPFYVSLDRHFGVYFLSRQIHARIGDAAIRMLVLTFAASLAKC